ncbi:MAG: aminotransferase class V-fold PLP-dependent enzyme [Patescibacteria group bacterium]
MKNVYLDHAATTPIDPRVLKAMLPFFNEKFGNPSALYQKGREALNAISGARKFVAQVFGCSAGEIIFTAGGTESDNLAILGAARANRAQGNHIITTKIEHHAVLHACEQLEKEGFKVTYLPVDAEGFVTTEQVLKAITPQTILVSVMFANNEIGTIEPVAEIGNALKKNHPHIIFHTDACQAAGALDLNVNRLHVDLLTLNGSKIYGPKGVGVLFKKRGVKIQPLIFGGEQEFALRPGTENTAGIIGLVTALELAQKNKDKENKRLIGLRNYLWAKLQKAVPKIKLNGPEPDLPAEEAGAAAKNLKRLPNNLNITILDIEGEALLLYLDEVGIQAATGSACTSESLEPSHVIRALGVPYEFAHGSLRFSLGHSNNKQQIDYLIKVLPGIVSKLREISPVNLDVCNPNKHAKYK